MFVTFLFAGYVDFNGELMHMAVCPAESDLKNLVEFSELREAGGGEETGDCWVEGEDVADKNKVVEV